MKKCLLSLGGCLLLLIIICACTGKNEAQVEVQVEEEECLCPHAVIYLQPYDDFTKAEAKKLVPKLREEFEQWLYGEWKFKVLTPKSLPKEGFIPERNRYRAMTILKSERKNLKSSEIIIGLTHKDICVDAHGVKDYGIVGLSMRRGQVCIASDKRLEKKSDYWKPILHEFVHTFYGSGHCPNDDPKCFMKDAKGHGRFGIQKYLCDKCMQ